MRRKATTVMMLVFWLAISSLATAADPLPSWTEGKAKQSIFAFVQRVTAPGSKDFVPEPERIAAFDNDGTLWAEQPLYFQLVFALDRVKELAPKHPEWKEKEPFKSVLAGDLKGKATLKTVQGQSVKARVGRYGASIGDAKIINTDIIAGNGVIHVIDSVITPR